MRSMKRIAAGVAAVVMAVSISACSVPSEEGGQETENKTRQSNYDRLTKNQPAESMDYSPTRETKNFWIRTWGEKGKLSYVYLMNGSGEVFGYFVMEGLPVSYCTSLIPPYQIKDYIGSNGGNALAVPGPSIDGTFSSSSNCNVFYGKDATSGAYLEYTAGMGINALLFSEPMPQYGAAQPLGDATLAEVKDKG